MGVAVYATDADALSDVGDGTLAGAMIADTTAMSETAGGAGVSAAGKGFFYQPLACATLHGQADLVTVLNAGCAPCAATARCAACRGTGTTVST